MSYSLFSLDKNRSVPITCQLILENNGLIISNSLAYPFKEAILSDAGGDISKTWYVNYYVWSEAKEKLVRKRSSFKQATKKQRYSEAAEFITTINEALKNGAYTDQVFKPELTLEISDKSNLEQACEYFLHKREKIVGPNTIRGYKKDLRGFMEWVESSGRQKLTVGKLSSMDVFAFSDYLDSKKTTLTDKQSGQKYVKTGVAKKTYSNFIATLRTTWAFLIERKILKINPWLDVKKRKGVSSQHIPYSPPQVRIFKNFCIEQLEDEQLWLFVNLIYYCFLRPREEAQNLKVKHVLAKTIIIPGEIAKNNTTEHVRIPKPLEELLRKHKIRDFHPNYYLFTATGVPGPKRVGINYFYSRNRKVLDLADLTDQEYDLYGWKHTGAIALYQATKDIKLVQAQCRHKDISTTDKYLRDLGLFLDEDALDRFPEAGA